MNSRLPFQTAAIALACILIMGAAARAYAQQTVTPTGTPATQCQPAVTTTTASQCQSAITATTATQCQSAVTTTTASQCQSAVTTATDGREYFVKVTEAVPDVILEIRYFSTYNFVGTRVDGYLAPTALLTCVAADSLRAASDEAMQMGYRFKIYDAYRPQMAVDHFVRWAADLTASEMKPYFYPDVDKSVLFDEGYIAAKSGHTRGSTVDLTLVDMATGKELDMGGVFDWFGLESHPDYCGDPDTQTFQGKTGCARKRLERKGLNPGLSQEQFNNRMILRSLMLRHGFQPIDSEWWHFTLKNEPFPDTYFTFPVQ